MKIVMMNGGLGNQLYQYTFLRLLEIVSNEKCIVDDSAFWGEKSQVEHNGYELDRIFNIKLDLLSDHFSKDVWKNMIENKHNGYSIPQQLADSGINFFMVAEAEDYSFKGNIIHFDCRRITQNTVYSLVNTDGNVYYHGYFVNPLYIDLIKDTLKKELIFPNIEDCSEIDKKNLFYQERIISENSVGIHIRRGDFLKCGRSLSADKYAKSIEHFNSKNNNCVWFVFSDDTDWCMKNKKELGLDNLNEVYFVTENYGNRNNYVDMQLMSKCKKLIISNSSFGCWASYLNDNPEMEIIMADNM